MAGQPFPVASAAASTLLDVDPPPASSRRSLAVIEALLEGVVARQAAMARSLDLLVEETPTSAELAKIYHEVNVMRTVISDYIAAEGAMLQSMALRQEALMSILSSILVKLPA